MDIALQLIHTTVTPDTGGKKTIGPITGAELSNVTDVNQNPHDQEQPNDQQEPTKEDTKKIKAKKKNKNKKKRRKNKTKTNLKTVEQLADIQTTSTAPLHSGNEQTVTMEDAKTSKNVVQGTASINNNGIKVLSPDFVKNFIQNSVKMMNANVSMHDLVRPPETTTSPISTESVDIIQTTKDNILLSKTTTGEIFHSTNKTDVTNITKVQEMTTVKSIYSSSHEVTATPQTSVTSDSTKKLGHLTTQVPENVSHSDNTVLNNTILPDSSQNSNTKIDLDHKHFHSDDSNIDLNTKVQPKDIRSGTVIIQENEDTIDPNDIDIVIFPSKRLDKRKRRRQRRRFCAKIDFGDVSKGFQCCKKTLNCFDDLPESFDENLFHNGNTHYGEAERIHLCHHIDEALVCHGDVLSRPGCKKVQHILEDKITPQLNKVKLFYFKNCNRSTLSPGDANPTFPPLSPNSTTGNGKVPDAGNKGTEHFHNQSNSYAPFIGGAVMGVFVLIVILLFVLYCRKRIKKRKKNKERRSETTVETQQSSRYKAVSYSRRKSDVYAEIDEKNMISSISYSVDGHCCSNNGSCGSRKLPSSPDIKRVEIDNHGYLSPRSSLPEDELKPDISNTNLFTHGYIELKSESGESAQSYAKLEPEPEEDYIQPDKIESSPSKKKSEEQNHMYFVLEKDNQESGKAETM